MRQLVCWLSFEWIRKALKGRPVGGLKRVENLTAIRYAEEDAAFASRVMGQGAQPVHCAKGFRQVEALPYSCGRTRSFC